MPVLDVSALDRLRHLNEPGQPDVVAEVLTIFCEDAPARLQAIAAAAHAGDGPAVQRAAHTMKGAAATIGASRLQRVCRDVEDLARRGALDQLDAAVRTIHEECDLVHAAIVQLLSSKA